MARTQLNVLHAMRDTLLAAYANVADPDAHEWGYNYVIGVMAACTQRAATNTALVQLSGALLCALPLDKQQYILENYNISVDTLDAFNGMDGVPNWPTVDTSGGLAGWPEPTAADLETYKATLAAMLAREIDRLSNSVVSATPRGVMKTLWSGQSCVRIKYGLHDGTDPDPADFPLVEEYRVKVGLATLAEAADALIYRGKVWAETEVSMQATAKTAAENITGADSMTVAKAYYDTALADMQAAVAAMPAV